MYRKKILTVCSISVALLFLFCAMFHGTKKMVISSKAATLNINAKNIPEELLEEQAKALLETMTLREKICQMLFTTPERIGGAAPVTQADETMEKALQTYPVGGILYSLQNLTEAAQTLDMIAGTQAMSKIPLFIAADEEGGTVSRLMKKLGTTNIASMYNYKDQGAEKAYQNAYTIARDMASYGFNLDFAPVADVWSNPDNTVIGKRAYSDNYMQAAELVGSAVYGFHDGGVLCTLKHFPGHGDTVEDSHKASAYVYKTKEELYAGELQPFVAGIAAGADFVMMGHLCIENIDTQNPATLSPTVIQGILRQDLGFQGIVITDALQMNAIADNYTVEEAAVNAVLAGNDMLLEPVDVGRTVNALVDAVTSGVISEERIDESVMRILKLKIKVSLIEA